MVRVEMEIEYIAKLLGTTKSTLYRWLADGKLKSLEPEVVLKFIIRQHEYRVAGLEVESSPSPRAPSVNTSQDTSPPPHVNKKESKVVANASWESEVIVEPSKEDEKRASSLFDRARREAKSSPEHIDLDAIMDSLHKNK